MVIFMLYGNITIYVPFFCHTVTSNYHISLFCDMVRLSYNKSLLYVKKLCYMLTLPYLPLYVIW